MSFLIGAVLVIVFGVWISSLQQRINILGKKGKTSLIGIPNQNQSQTTVSQMPVAPQITASAVSREESLTPQPSAFANWLKED